MTWTTAGPRRWRLALLWVGFLALAWPLVFFAPKLFAGTELTRVRNAVLMDTSLPPDIDWNAPPSALAGFTRDRPPFDPYFDALARRVLPADAGSDWDAALAIARHLLASGAPLKAGGIRSDLRTTHARIVGEGVGYCADFVRVFSALASAAGLDFRLWAFSFDGFGGHGHIWPEIWDRSDRRWKLLDLFSNQYFRLPGSAVPLSAMDFRAALQGPGAAPAQLVPIEPRVRPGWIHAEKAFEYYRRGLSEWYMRWGTNLMEVERHPVFRLLRPMAYPLAHAAMAFTGVAPPVRPLQTLANGREVEALRTLRSTVHAAAVSLLLGLAALGAVTVLGRRAAGGPSRV